MDKFQSSPSHDFDDLILDENAKNLSEIDPKTVSKVPNQGEMTTVYVYKVIDGDTIKVLYNYGNKVHKIDIRVNGVDTPESRRASDMEKKACKIVGKVVSDKIFEQLISVKFLNWDKYGGRMVGDVYLPSGETLCEFLIANKLGHPYDGKVKKSSWLPEELDYIIGFGA